MNAGVTIAVTRVACNTAVAAQTITTSDLNGLTPKAAWFIITEAITDGVAATHAVMGIGAATATDERWAFTARSENGVDVADCDRRGMTDECICIMDPNVNAIDGEADLTAWVTNGCTITWGSLPAAAYLLTVVFFAGDDLDAKADVVVLPNVLNGSVDENTVAFEPDMVLTGTFGGPFNDASALNNMVTVGVAINDGADSQFCTAFRSTNNAGIGQPESRVTATYAAIKLNAGATLQWAAEWDAYDAQGFSVINRIAASANQIGYLALAFNGVVDFWADIIDSPVANGNQSITAPAFKPQFVMAGLNNLAALDTAYTTGVAGTIGISTFDVDSEYCNSIQDEDAAGVMDTQSMSDDAAVNLPQDDGSAGYAATLVSLDAEGWTWNFTAQLGAAHKWVALAIEESRQPRHGFTNFQIPGVV